MAVGNIADTHGRAINDQGEFQEAVRVRLGCGGPRDHVECSACGQVILDGTGRHASANCIGEATRGHNRCVEVTRAVCVLPTFSQRPGAA